MKTIKEAVYEGRVLTIDYTDASRDEVLLTSASKVIVTKPDNIHVDGAVFPPSRKTKFGVLINNMHDDLTAQAEDNLGAEYIRESTAFANNAGVYVRHDRYIVREKKLVPTLTWNGQNNTPFVKDMKAWEEKLRSYLNIYAGKIYMVAIENEPANAQYHEGDMSLYITQLKVSCRVCKEFNVLVADGGLSTSPLRTITYRWLKDNPTEGLMTAEEFKTKCVPVSVHKNLDKPGAIDSHEKDVQEHIYLIQEYAKIPELNFINLHLYMEFVNSRTGIAQATTALAAGLKEIITCIRCMTGKDVITNEVGQINHNPELTTAIMQALEENNVSLAIWYSGDKPDYGGPVALTDNDGKLRATGIAFRNYINQ